MTNTKKTDGTNTRTNTRTNTHTHITLASAHAGKDGTKMANTKNTNTKKANTAKRTNTARTRKDALTPADEAYALTLVDDEYADADEYTPLPANEHGIAPYAIGERVCAKEVGRMTMTALNRAKSFCRFKSGVYTGKDEFGRAREDEIQARRTRKRVCPYHTDTLCTDTITHTSGRPWDGASSMKQFQQTVEGILDYLYHHITEDGLREDILNIKSSTHTPVLNTRTEIARDDDGEIMLHKNGSVKLLYGEHFGEYEIREFNSTSQVKSYDGGLVQYAEDCIHNALVKLYEFDGEIFSVEIEKAMRKNIQRELYASVERAYKHGDVSTSALPDDYISYHAVDVDAHYTDGLSYKFRKVLSGLHLTAKEKLVIERMCTRGYTQVGVREDLGLTKNELESLRDRVRRALASDERVYDALTRGKYARGEYTDSKGKTHIGVTGACEKARAKNERILAETAERMREREARKEKARAEREARILAEREARMREREARKAKNAKVR